MFLINTFILHRVRTTGRFTAIKSTCLFPQHFWPCVVCHIVVFSEFFLFSAFWLVILWFFSKVEIKNNIRILIWIDIWVVAWLLTSSVRVLINFGLWYSCCPIWDYFHSVTVVNYHRRRRFYHYGSRRIRCQFLVFLLFLFRDNGFFLF